MLIRSGVVNLEVIQFARRAVAPKVSRFHTVKTGDALGDSLYEARIYVRGKVASCGADCVEKPMQKEHRDELMQLLERAGFDGMKAADFRRYGSARELYNFQVDNAGAY